MSAPYKNIQINEEVHYMDDTLTNGCYISIIDVNIPSLKSLIALYNINIYKNKTLYESHPEWDIRINEIPYNIQIQFSPEFTEGDLVEKISNELKLKIIELNPTWNPENIIIED